MKDNLNNLKKLNQPWSGSRAFTLIEMLSIIAIIVLLLGIAAPSALELRRSILTVRSRATLGAIESACQQYNNDFGEFPPSNSSGYANLPDWEGKQLLPLLLTGYGPDNGNDGNPAGKMDSDDGKDAFGYRVVKRGRVYGPYNETDKLHTAGSPTAFVDAFDDEIYYYRYDPSAAPNSKYDAGDNSNGPDDINHYAKRDDGADDNYFRHDFILLSIGNDNQWQAYQDDPEKFNDITNFFEY